MNNYNTPVFLAFVLLVVYQLKHFIVDYPLQGKYMLGKFKGGWDWVLPLAAHAGLHGLFTFFIALTYNLCCWPNWFGWWGVIIGLKLALFDFVIHFTMDRIKASPNLMGRWKALSAQDYIEAQGIIKFQQTGDLANSARRLLKKNTYFWWALGFDQMIHHLTHYVIIAKLVGLI